MNTSAGWSDNLMSKKSQMQSVLIVDDDPISMELLNQTIPEDCQIYQANTGSQALAIAFDVHPDVILLDMRLPDIDGLEVCQTIKKCPATRHCSVIFVTASGELQAQTDALAAGGIDFIQKPIHLPMCQLKVRNYLNLQAQTRKLELVQQDLSNIISSLPVHVSTWTSTWENLYSNDDGSWFGAAADQTKGQKIYDIFPPDLAEQIRGNEPLYHLYYQSEAVIQDGNKQRYVQVNVSSRHYMERHYGFLVTLLDITSLKQSEIQLRQEKERIRVTLNSIGDGVIATNMNGNITYMNPIAEKMTGFSASEARNRPIETVMPLTELITGKEMINPLRYALLQQKSVSLELNSELTNRQGDRFRVEETASPIRDDQGNMVGALIVFQDVSESVDIPASVSHLANHDPLTNLPNRILLHDRLEQAILISGEKDEQAAVILLDLDNFQVFNETRGQHFGDQLIRQFSQKLRDFLDPRYTLARVGSEEFVIVWPQIENIAALEQLTLRLADIIQQPLELDNESYKLSYSMGISVFPEDGYTPDELMRRANLALAKAKQLGRNQFCYFSEQLEGSLWQRQKSESLLSNAIRDGRINVHYQPKVDLPSGTIISAEALVRIISEDGNLIFPGEFLTMAKDSGQIHALDAEVMRIAIHDAANWQKDFPGVGLSLNITASGLLAPNFVRDLYGTLNTFNFPPDLLEIEVTESALMDSVEEVKRVINILRVKGVKMSIDDFGTGYTCLSQLQKFNVHTLKIDQAFIRAMLNDADSENLVQTIIRLGQSLNLTLCPEGIETEEQSKFLSQAGCNTGQGYLFSKPLALDEFRQFMQENLGLPGAAGVSVVNRSSKVVSLNHLKK